MQGSPASESTDRQVIHVAAFSGSREVSDRWDVIREQEQSTAGEGTAMLGIEGRSVKEVTTGQSVKEVTKGRSVKESRMVTRRPLGRPVTNFVLTVVVFRW